MHLLKREIQKEANKDKAGFKKILDIDVEDNLKDLLFNYDPDY